MGKSEHVAAFGIIVGIVAAIFWAATNCSWWDHSFCDDGDAIGNRNIVLLALAGLAVLLFFVGGIAREINMEGRLGREVHNVEFVREYNNRSITNKPLLPNLMVVVGLILVFGISATLLGALDSSQQHQSFYQIMSWSLGITGIALSVTGFYLKSRAKNMQATRGH